MGVTINTLNRIADTGFTYDTPGNLIAEPQKTYTYDAENKMTQSVVSGVTVAYVYDGDGKRVKKDQTNGSTYDKLYWYGTGADPLEESNLTGTASADFIFFNGKRTARLDLPSATVHYYFANHLGSTSVVTSSTGTIQDESDYFPFGGEKVVTDTDPNQYKFTGKGRDLESGLDFFIARYYSSQYGRFLSPDEFSGGAVDAFSTNDPLPPSTLLYADVTNPQSLNKYTYVLNNPLIYTDPEGHDNVPPDLIPEGFGSVGCPPGAPVCGDSQKKKKKGAAGMTAQDVDEGVGKALTNEIIGLQNSANAVARLAGEKDVPDDKPLLQPSTPGETIVMNMVSALLLASAVGGGKGKVVREAGEEVLERHHWLVRQFKAFFKRRGLSIEGYVESIPRGEHRAAGASLHGSEFNLNKRWGSWIKEHGSATKAQIVRQYRNLRAQWNRFRGSGL